MAKERIEWEEASDRLEMRVTPTFLKVIDEWRRREPDIPTRTEAVRRLVAIAVKKDRRK